MLNSFSRANRMLTPSRESIPSSSKVLSMVTLSGGSFCVAAMTEITLWLSWSGIVAR